MVRMLCDQSRLKQNGPLEGKQNVMRGGNERDEADGAVSRCGIS